MESTSFAKSTVRVVVAPLAMIIGVDGDLRIGVAVLE